MELTNESVLTTIKPLTLNHKVFRKTFRNKLIVKSSQFKEVIVVDSLAGIYEALLTLGIIGITILVYFG